MSHLCECGHLPSEHYGDAGRCEGECFDTDYGIFACLCHAYTKDDTDD